jgi:hypothetical protein
MEGDDWIAMSKNPTTLHPRPLQKLRHSVIYSITGITMIIVAYFHLDFAARGFENVTLQRIYGNPLIIIIILSIILMLVSSVLVWAYPLRAAKTGMVASFFGWLYFLIAFCSLWVLASVFMFTRLTFWLFFIPNAVLLFLTTRISRRIIALAKERGA